VRLEAALAAALLAWRRIDPSTRLDRLGDGRKSSAAASVAINLFFSFLPAHF
jgi:hypothetical protein